MKLSYIFNSLASGELKQLDMSDCGEIKPKYNKELITHIKLALTALHTKFPLKTKEVFITEHEGISIYHLKRKYAATNTTSTEPVKYIADTEADPFVDDVLVIDSVYNELGETLYMNDDSAEWSVYTPNHLSIQLVLPVEGNTFSAIYRADHPPINPNVDPDEEDIDLPEVYLQPLLYYVASRVYAGMNSQESWSTSINYKNMYELACTELAAQGIYNTEQTGNLHFESRGWV